MHCIGRQEGSDVFLLGPTLQFRKSGEAIPKEAQQYVWIPYILKKFHVHDTITPIADELPEVHHPLRKVVKGLKRISGENFGSALFLLGKHVACELSALGYITHS